MGSTRSSEAAVEDQQGGRFGWPYRNVNDLHMKV